MAAVLVPERTLTQLDHIRLTRLLTGLRATRNTGPLDQLLDASDLVASPSVPPDIVTMCSQVLVADEPGGAPMKVRLCYPDDADPAAGMVSVLAPLGAALLGLRVGELAHWAGPGGESHAVRILAMLFQPEAAGDYTT